MKLCQYCGSMISEDDIFCIKCGLQVQIPSTKKKPVIQHNYQYINPDYYQGYNYDEVPEVIKGWNWGAFTYTLYWCIAMNLFKIEEHFLVWNPLVGFTLPFHYGANGNALAWRSRNWNSVEHFISTQRVWNVIGLGSIIVQILFIIIAFILGLTANFNSLSMEGL